MLRDMILSLVVLLLSISQGVSAEPRPQVAIIAHRGLLRFAPENTLSNFQACLSLRLAFEVDVQETQDGSLVCVHDATVQRTTDGRGRVTELRLDQIRKLDAGGWFDAQFDGEVVPTFEEVMKLVQQAPARTEWIAIDLKSEGIEAKVVRTAKQHGVLDQVVFIGRAINDSTVRGKLRQAATEAHVAAVANSRDEFEHALNAKHADIVYFRYLPDQREIELLRKKGKRSMIAGVKVSGAERENWLRAVNSGVDAILTDYPLFLRTTLRSMSE